MFQITRRSIIQTLAAVAVAALGVCRKVFGRWTWPGYPNPQALRIHLMTVHHVQPGPNMVAQHDAIHEGRPMMAFNGNFQGGIAMGRPRVIRRRAPGGIYPHPTSMMYRPRPRPMQFRSGGGCPGGICPGSGGGMFGGGFW